MSDRLWLAVAAILLGGLTLAALLTRREAAMPAHRSVPADDTPTGHIDPVPGWDANGDPNPPDLQLDPAPQPAPRIEPGGEPVVLAQAVTVIVAAVLGLVWKEADETTIKLLASAIGTVIILAATAVARSRVWTGASVRRELERRP